MLFKCFYKFFFINKRTKEKSLLKNDGFNKLLKVGYDNFLIR
ncbi:hypothetical protein HMPREF9087_2306 [Enterococcus casseliflavus ATCC 12755]|uniref:Uncharacterized protein n=1 Tax=Enterococcus casseliflavus ATCC 12755 TaxID=888066 RepID=F0ELL4_ENTCA|nr:hypothetical protein HMPREF9087_2306 [Enterococcus casseliflavus ATCC 12755]